MPTTKAAQCIAASKEQIRESNPEAQGGRLCRDWEWGKAEGLLGESGAGDAVVRFWGFDSEASITGLRKGCM